MEGEEKRGNFFKTLLFPWGQFSTGGGGEEEGGDRTRLVEEVTGRAQSARETSKQLLSSRDLLDSLVSFHLCLRSFHFCGERRGGVHQEGNILSRRRRKEI